ncbi:MAG: polysaccharide export protein EpsE [Betaproteobacteria bacterium]|nr:polysaccharide export protein EpsE [Betaproteobacteria bacterium]
MSSQRLFGILVLAVVALAAIPRESSGAPLVVGQDYYSVQLLSGTSAAVLQESLALVADQPYARIEKRGAEYTLRLGYWESRDEAVQAAKVLLPKFRGAHTRIAPYQPDAIVAGAGEQPPIAAVPHPLTGARAPGGGTRETTVQAEREAAKLAAERAEAERRAEAAAQERSAAEARALREATIRQQAEAQAEAAARERVAAEREAMAQAVLREKAETEALRLAESRRDAERRPTAEVSPLRAEPEQSQAQLPGMPRPPQLVAGQDYHSVQLLSGTSVAVLQESLARVAGEPHARIDKRGAAYALRVGYWDTRAEAVQAAKALLRKFRGAHARIATYRPDAIVASAGEQPTRATAPVPSAPEVPPPSIASAAEQPSEASAPVPATPEVSPRRTEPAQLQAQVPAVSREEQQNKPELARQIEYQLGAGDMIKIVVFQNPDLTVEARVTENGTISFPLIGEVKVGGFTIPAAEQTIAKALKDGGFIQQPQVNIVLQQIRGYQVAVLGQVNRPGRFPLDTLNVRVSEMIAIAGGITVATGADVAVLTGTREGKPFRKEIDIAGMFADRNRLQDDLVVAGGDVIYVQRAPIFYIYGEVQRPGSYRVERNMTVRQALAQGGGPTLRGTERWLRLHRRGADGKVAILRPGFDDPVQPDDVIYVRESIF